MDEVSIFAAGFDHLRQLILVPEKKNIYIIYIVTKFKKKIILFFNQFLDLSCAKKIDYGSFKIENILEIHCELILS